MNITPTSCENRAINHVKALALEEESVANAWADPVQSLAILHGIKLGVHAVFEAMAEASEGGDRS